MPNPPSHQARPSASTRAFIAISMPPAVTEIIAVHVERLRALVPKGIKWVDPRTSHLTLTFLGNVPDARLSTLSQILNDVAGASPTFQLEVGALGAFPNARNSRVLWAALEGDTLALSNINLRLQDALSAQGFPREKRPFKPHVTVGRARGQRPIRLPENALAPSPGPCVAFDVRELVLMSSVLTPQGPIHTPLSRAPLSTS